MKFLNVLSQRSAVVFPPAARTHRRNSARTCFLVAAAAVPALLFASCAHAQHSDPVAVHWVQQAVDSQIAANRDDHSSWIFLDHDIKPGSNILKRVVQTPQGDEYRVLERNGQKLTPQQEQQETQRIRNDADDTEAHASRSRDAAEDARKENALLRLWPTSFIWRIESQNPEFITLAFEPDPRFNAPNLEARIMGKMAGEMVVMKQGTRLYSLHGHLTQTVRIAFGLVKLDGGGTFDVERREIAPGHWQIVKQDTNIHGHALLFKTISEQEDETMADFKPSPAKTLREAAQILGAN